MSKMEITEHWVDGEPMIGFDEIDEGPRFPCAGLNCSCTKKFRDELVAQVEGLFPTKRYFGPSRFRKMWSVNVSIEFQPKDCKNHQEYDEFDQRYHDQHE